MNLTELLNNYVMKIILTILMLTSYLSWGQVDSLTTDTVTICRVGRPEGSKRAYKVNAGQKLEYFKDLTIKDKCQRRKFFKSPSKAAEYIGGEIIGIKYKQTAKEEKVVYIVELKK